MDSTPALAKGGLVTGPGHLVGGTECLIASRATEGTESPCPYCSRPNKWSACPIHTDGQDQTEDED